MKPINIFFILLSSILVSCKSPTEHTFVKKWVCVAQSPNSKYAYLGKVYTVYYGKLGDYMVYDFTGDGLGIQCLAEDDTTIADRFLDSANFKFRYIKSRQRLIMEEYGKPNGLEWEAVKQP